MKNKEGNKEYMGNTLFNQSFIFTLTIVFMVIGILYQIAIGVFYQKMIQETDNMSGSENKVLKQCKERFVTCYKMNGGVSNIPVFVDKYINRIKFCGMGFNFMRHLSGQMMLAGVFVAGFGVCKGIIEGRRFIDLLPFYIICLFGIYLYLSITAIVDMPGRRQMLKTNLMDYLENHIAERLEHGLTEKEKLLRELEQEKERNGKDRVAAGDISEDSKIKAAAENISEADKIKVTEANAGESGKAKAAEVEKVISEKTTSEKTAAKDDKSEQDRPRHLFSEDEAKELEELLRSFMV